MKKIIRTAIVLALAVAGASLLSTGCTKDYSQDINDMNGKITNLQQAVTALQSFQATAQKQIDANTASLAAVTPKVEQLGKDIESLATATGLSIIALSQKIDEEVTEIYKAITAVTGRVEALETAMTEAQAAIAQLKSDVDALRGRITSIVAVPSASADIMTIKAPSCGAAGDTTVKVFSATFEICPAEAAANLTAENLTITYREGKTKAAAKPIYEEGVAVEILDITKGFVTVSAFAPKADLQAGNSLYYAINFEGKDASDSVYTIKSDYTKAVYESTEAKYAIAVGGKLVKADAATPTEFNDTVALVYNDVKRVKFAEDAELVAVLWDQTYTMEQYTKLLGLKSAPVVKLAADTTFWTNTDATYTFNKKDVEIVVDTLSAKSAIFDGNPSTGKHALMKASYLINGKDAKVIRRRVVVITKAVKENIDVTATVPIVWNYQAVIASVSGKKVAVPAIYNGKTKRDATKCDVLDPKGKSASYIWYDFNASAANDTAKVGLQIEWPKEATQYEACYAFENDTLIYAIDVPFAVSAKPADQKIALADSTIAWAADGNVTLSYSPVEVSISDTTLYKGDLKNVKATDIYKYFADHAVSAIDSVVCEGKNVTTATAPVITVNYPAKSTIKLSSVKSGKTYTVFYNSKVNGIKYSYTQNIAVKGVAYAIATDPLFVKNDTVQIVGIVGSNKYALSDVNLANYFKVDGTIPSGDAVTMNFKSFNEAGTDHDSTALGIVNFPAAPASAAVTASTGRIPATSFTWGSYTARTVVVKAWLTTASGAIGDTIKVAIVAPQTIKDFKGGEIAKDRTNGQDLNINLWENIFASSCLADTNVFNPKATTLASAQVKSIDYGQVVTFDFSKAKAELNGAAYTLDASYFTVTDGVLTVKKECGLFTAPLKITVPAKATYKYDYDGKKALESNVVITITQK